MNRVLLLLLSLLLPLLLVSCSDNNVQKIDSIKEKELEYKKLLDEEINMLKENDGYTFSEELWKKTDGYPLDNTMDEWYSLSEKEKQQACEMPEKLLKSIDTSDLLEYVINYPYYSVRNAIESNIDNRLELLFDSSNIYREFRGRKDCNIVLVNKYQGLSIDFDTISKYYSKENKDGKMERVIREFVFCERYLDIYINELSSDERLIVDKKYEEIRKTTNKTEEYIN